MVIIDGYYYWSMNSHWPIRYDGYHYSLDDDLSIFIIDWWIPFFMIDLLLFTQLVILSGLSYRGLRSWLRVLGNCPGYHQAHPAVLPGDLQKSNRIVLLWHVHSPRLTNILYYILTALTQPQFHTSRNYIVVSRINSAFEAQCFWRRRTSWVSLRA